MKLLQRSSNKTGKVLLEAGGSKVDCAFDRAIDEADGRRESVEDGGSEATSAWLSVVWVACFSILVAAPGSMSSSGSGLGDGC